jgi:hypothetical protein
MVRRAKKQARAGAWREFWFCRRARPTWVPASGAKEKRVNPWSALLNGGMLAQGNGRGNEEGCSRALFIFQEEGDGSKTALRFSLLDLGSSRVRV